MSLPPTLESLRDLRERGASIPLGLQIESIVRAVLVLWGAQAAELVAETARNGVALTDLAIIRWLIRGARLDCHVQECATALLRCCWDLTDDEEGNE